MTEITASLVNKLRKVTGAGIMECKKALTEMGGDPKAAEEHMRKTGLLKASKKASRVAAEGTIVVMMNTNGSIAALVEINTETDFVAREAKVRSFAQAVGQCVLDNHCADVSKLVALPLSKGNDETVDNARLSLIAQLGENITVRRVMLFESQAQLGVYGHGDANGTRIGAMVELKGGSAELARDLAMQVAAMNPEYRITSEIPADRLTKEREILTEQTLEQLRAEGKPEDKLAMIVEGKVNKFAKESTLLGQAFVKDPSMTVEALLKKAGAEVLRFARFEVGEGIEKKADNFVEEVMAQARGA